MTPEAIQTVQPIYSIFAAIVVSGVASTLAVEILKSKYIPVGFQRYPRLTAAVASVVASVVAAYNSSVSTLGIDTPIEWAALIAGVLIISALTYNNIFKGATKSYI